MNVLAMLLRSGLLTACLVSTALGAGVDFRRDVQPILRRHCDRCHGASNQEASLSLATSEGLLGVADSGETIVIPHDADSSLLLRRVTDPDEGDLMPLDGRPLLKSEIDVLGRWIDEGATMPTGNGPAKHWAYDAPVVDNEAIEQASDQDVHPIDYFIQQGLDDANLAAGPPADRATLARRVSLALTGLPATPAQIDRLIADDSEEAFSRFVDELLASDAFGVHWARHWLDLARYADSNGFQADQLRDSWAYRDWVVDAFNADMPFDQFVIHQLAGDLLEDADAQSRIATGFHRTPTCNVEAGVHPEANRVQQVFDRVNTTATVFLGATMECAQCHDHKYDPFTQRDYYKLFAYFNNTPLEVKNTSGVTYDFVGPKMDLPLPANQQAKLETLETRLSEMREDRKALTGADRFDAWREHVTELLAQGRARWITPKPNFSATGGEAFQIFDDQSVLLDDTIPGSTVYEFQYSGIEGPVAGIRIDALQHESLPGSGPGKGDAERTNFVLHELELELRTGKRSRALALGDAKASFSQARYEVAGAVDGNRKTGWAIAPKFKQAHWATFRVVEPVEISPEQTLVVSLDQHFGRGRVIGRPKVSLLMGPPETAELTDEVVSMLTSDTKLTKKELGKLKKYHREHDPQILAMDRKIKSAENRLKTIQPDTTLVMVEEEETRETFVMLRGDYQAKGESVAPGTPSSLHPLDEDLPPTRLGLAKWMVDPANPLLARVTVNRFWAEVFGRGIVATPEDFGTQSDAPSHPELIDWLALDFQAKGWSVKSLLKQMVTSRAFGRSSTVSPSWIAADPENAFLSRGPRYRLHAETIRDNALFVAGLLSQDRGGAPIMPYQPDGIWRAVGRNQPKWKAATDPDRYRRGLYVVWKRSAPYPSFVTFDAPDRASCTVKRPRTNTPLQALALMNDHTYAEASVGLAQRMLTECESGEPRELASYGYRLATGQLPSSRTLDALVRLYQEQREQMKQQPEQARSRTGVLLDVFRRPLAGDKSIAETELAAWYTVANVLLNLDQTITLN